MTPAGRSAAPAPGDPVLARRRVMARWADRAKRAGYLLYGAAVLLFLVAMVADLPRGLVHAIVACLAVGSVLLAPAIVVGYGVKAADREDRERAATARTGAGGDGATQPR